MDAGCASDEGASRGRRSRGVLIPRRWYQVCGEFRRRRRQQARLSGETTKETVKTIRAGSAGSFRRTCGVLTRVVFSPPREAAGAHVAPGIPCALFIGGSRVLQAPGRLSRRGKAEARLESQRYSGMVRGARGRRELFFTLPLQGRVTAGRRTMRSVAQRQSMAV
jgi:hypothetical protein